MSKRKPTKAVRLAVSALLQLSGRPLPRQHEQATLFKASRSDICRDQPDIQDTLTLVRSMLTEAELAALVEHTRVWSRLP